MLTKIEAAQIATEAGIDTVIIGNQDPALLYELFEGRANLYIFQGGKLRKGYLMEYIETLGANAKAAEPQYP